MSILSLILPEIGKPDFTEDPKVNTALTTIETWANGEIDGTNNIKAEGITTASIKGEAVTTAKIKEEAVTNKKLELSHQIGEWKALTLAGVVGEAAESYTPSSRLEAGIVRLKGKLLNTSGVLIKGGVTLATIGAAGERPTKGPARFSYVRVVPGPVADSFSGSVETSGVIVVTDDLAIGGIVCLDSVTFSVA